MKGERESMASNESNTDTAARGYGSREKTRIQRRALMMMYIMDLLPFEDEAAGKTASELVPELARLGIEMNRRALERALEHLRRVGNIEWSEGMPRRYKRFHSQRASECLAPEWALPKNPAPELDSEIRVDRKRLGKRR